MILCQKIYYKKGEHGIIIVAYDGASTLIIPDNIKGIPVTEIAENAFSEENIKHTNHLEEITYSEQQYCFIEWQEDIKIEKTNALQKVILPNSIQKIGKSAFSYCSALTQIDLPKYIKIIPERCFSHCIALKEIKIPESVTDIQKYAFHDCIKLERIYLPNSISVLGDYVFYNNYCLYEIVLPENIFVGMGAFKNCKSLKKVMLQGNTAFLDVFADLEQEVEMHIINMPKEQKGCTEAKLFFPDFEYEYMENYPARQFKQMNYGSGYLYHQCIHNSGIDFIRYDDLFSMAKREETKYIALEIAFNRLQYPYKLREKNEMEYMAFLKQNILFAVKSYLQEIEKLYFLSKLNGIFTSENIDNIIDIAIQQKNVQAISFLTDYKMKHFGINKKSFDL